MTRQNIDKDVSSPWVAQTWQTQIVRSITNDATNWCLGMPTQMTVQNSLPGGTSVTRTTGYSVDYPHCRTTQEVAEPGAINPTQTTTVYGFDTCGNVNSISVTGTTPTGIAMPARLTQVDFGTRCAMPESTTNAEHEKTLFANRYNVGLRFSQTDPNGLTSSRQYDNYSRPMKDTHTDGSSVLYTYGQCNASNSFCGAPDLRTGIEAQSVGINGVPVRESLFYLDGFDRQRYDLETNVAGTLSYSSITLYDALGNTQYQYVPFLPGGTQAWHKYVYDGFNRPPMINPMSLEVWIDRPNTAMPDDR